MTTTIYLTGDRSFQPVPAVSIVNLVLMQELLKHPEGIKVLTGDSVSGIERAVRYLIPEGTVGVFQREADEEGRVDFDGPHKQLASQVDKVIVIHTDPLNSRLAKSVAQNFPPEKVEYPLDEIVNQAPADIAELLDEKPEPVNEEEVPPEN